MRLTTTRPGKSIRGLYIIESASTLTNNDFIEFERRGCTHIFYSESLLLRNLTTCKININTVLSKLEDTTLKLYADVLPFKNSTLETVNPDDTTNRDSIITNIKSLLDDTPQLEGVSFNDLQYPSTIYDPSLKESEDLTLQAWIKNVYNELKDHSPDHKVVASMAYSPYTPRSPNLNLLGDYLDYVMPQLYPNLQLVDSSFITTQLNKLVVETETDIIVNLDTYTADDDLTPRSCSEIYTDMEKVTRRYESQVKGYAIYTWPYNSSDLYFYDKLLYRSAAGARQGVVRAGV